MRFNILFPLILYIFPTVEGWNQQLPIFSLFRENQGILNAAAVPPEFMLTSDQPFNLVGGITHKSYWISNAGGTSTQVLRAEYLRLQNDRSFAPLLGMYILNDRIGPTSFTGIYGRMAPVFGLNHPKAGGISAGLSFGAVHSRIKTKEIDLLDPNDVLGANNIGQWRPDLGAGLFVYKNFKKNNIENLMAYAGFSMAQLFKNDLAFRTEAGDFPFTREPHYYSMAGFYKFIDNAFSFISLSAWGRSVQGVPLSANVMAQYQRAGKWWTGIGTTIEGMLHFEFGTYTPSLLAYKTTSKSFIMKLGIGADAHLGTANELPDRTFEVNISFIPLN